MRVAIRGAGSRNGQASRNAGRPCFRLLVSFWVACAVGLATPACSTAAASASGPPALQAVVSDAAKRMSTGARKVQVIRTEKMEWPDSALGCPRPGEMYVQMTTPGWLIEVRSGQRALEYHTDASDRFVLCTPRP